VHAGVTGYTLLWDSAEEAPGEGLGTDHAPGEQVTIQGPSMRLFRVDGSPA
jgi:glycogen operon protein